MVDDGYPVSSLKRDDARTVRFLRILASEFRAADRHQRALQGMRNEGDSGPTYLEQMASMTDQVRNRYEAREYDEANRLLKTLSNRVARLRTDPDVERASAKDVEGQTIGLWKACWTIAADEFKTKLGLEHNAGSIADSEKLIARAAAPQGGRDPGGTINDERGDEILAVREWAKTLVGSEREGPLKDAALLGVEDGALAAQDYFDTHADRFSWASDMVRADRGIEMVAAILPEPKSSFAVHRAEFSRKADLQACYEVYRGTYSLAVGRLVLERQRRPPPRSATEPQSDARPIRW
jgi:hypothetical protein